MSIFSSVAKLAAKISFLMPPPLYSFCDLETTDGRSLITREGDYVSLVRIHGRTRMTGAATTETIVEALRVELQGALEAKGQGIQCWYACDPTQTGATLEGLLAGPRAVAREMGMSFEDIFAERAEIWSKVMRWEDCYLVLWTRRAMLSREEASQAAAERDAAAKNMPKIGTTGLKAQNIFLASEILGVKHTAFVSRVIAAFANQHIILEEIEPRAALILMREALYPETRDSNWTPSLPGDPLPIRMPDLGETVAADHVLWPNLPSQIFRDDAETLGSRAVRIGDHDYAAIEVVLGPEIPRPFAELVARLARTHVPWRASVWLESGGPATMAFKSMFAELLAFDPENRKMAKAFEALGQMKRDEADIAVRWRMSFATWVPAGESVILRRNVAILEQRIQGWGNCRLGLTAGDALQGVMGSALGLTFGSTAPVGYAPLSDALRMLPLTRPASPWKDGSVVFRAPDGRIWPYDPAGSGRQAVFITILAAPRRGKSTLANAMNLGLALSRAGLGSQGAKLPLIGKLDIGKSALGLVLLLQEELPPERRHEAVFVEMQFGAGYDFNIFDTQLGCRYPLRLEETFIINFLSLAMTSPETDRPFEGMDQFIPFVVSEAYRMRSDEGANTAPTVYQRGIEPRIDEAIDRIDPGLRMTIDRQDPKAKTGESVSSPGPEITIGSTNSVAPDVFWWEVVDLLCAAREYRLAELAQRRAVPMLDDLITASRSNAVRDNFRKIQAHTGESLPEVFERNIKSLIRLLPSLNQRTTIDLGEARVIVLDLDRVAPRGDSAEAVRITSLMYMLGRHMIARNFFLNERDLRTVPAAMRAYHARRLIDVSESIKRLDYDEYHRTRGSRYVRAQVVNDVLEGGKWNIQVVVTTQSIAHLDDELIRNVNERFFLGTDDEHEADEIIRRFNLSEESALTLRRRLTGPDSKGGGAPFLLQVTANNQRYEHMLVNSLGPIEIWALSTTPLDMQLRARVYQRLGPAEARRRLARIFPAGTALREIERRKEERLKRGEAEDKAVSGVVDEIAAELIDLNGIAAQLRGSDQDYRLAAE
jgi:intracellular multiplication protein IcmB